MEHTTARNLSDEEVKHQAEALAAYLAKPGNRGGSWWLKSKDFGLADQLSILSILWEGE